MKDILDKFFSTKRVARLEYDPQLLYIRRLPQDVLEVTLGTAVSTTILRPGETLKLTVVPTLTLEAGEFRLLPKADE